MVLSKVDSKIDLFIWPIYGKLEEDFSSHHAMFTVSSVNELRKIIINQYPGNDVIIQKRKKGHFGTLVNIGVLYTGTNQGYWRAEGKKTIVRVDPRTGALIQPGRK